MKTAFLFYFSKFTGTIHTNLKQMWKNKFSENEFEWQIFPLENMKDRKEYCKMGTDDLDVCFFCLFFFFFFFFFAFFISVLILF